MTENCLLGRKAFKQTNTFICLSVRLAETLDKYFGPDFDTLMIDWGVQHQSKQ